MDSNTVEQESPGWCLQAPGHPYRPQHVGRLHACSENSLNMISVSHWQWQICLIFINDNISEDKLSKFLFQREVCASNW